MQNAKIKLKIGSVTFSCTVLFRLTRGYPAKLTGHPDDQYSGMPNSYALEHITVYADGVHVKADYLIDAYTDEIGYALDKYFKDNPNE